jgi:glycosyltransferase involved in cell wall biosynthesis
VTWCLRGYKNKLTRYQSKRREVKSKKDMPKISVLIPLYNMENFIAQAIESVLEQTFSDLELIIVDNCSTDRSITIARHYESDKRVKIFQNSENIGAVRNWNQCMLYASGEYLKFLFADDYFKKNALEEFIKPFEADQSVSLVIAPREFLFDNGSMTKYPLSFSGFKKGSDVIKEIFFSDNILGEPTFIMFRKKDMNIGLFNIHIVWSGDIDYWLRICESGNAFAIKEYCAVYRRHQQQITTDVMKSGGFFMEERNFLYYNFFIRPSAFQNMYPGYYKSIWRSMRSHLYQTSYRKQKEYLKIWPLFELLQLRLYLFIHNIYRTLKRKKK